MNDRSPDTDVPTLFTGMPRSGTTYLGELAYRYLDTAAVNEGTFEFWLAEQLPQGAVLPGGKAYRRLLARFAHHLYFRFLYGADWNIDRVARELDAQVNERTPAGLATGALRLAAWRWRLPRLGHEDPQLLDDLPTALRMVPGARVVHIVRDPRDVTASVLQFPWGPNNAVVAAEDWAQKVGAARNLGARLGADRYLEFRYEDLLARPAETMAALLRFVTGTADPQRVARFVAETEANPLRTNTGTWRQKLTPAQAGQVEGAARDVMAAYGYEPATAAPRVSAVAAKIWRLHHRTLQLKNIVTGRLHLNGSGRVTPQP